MNAHVATNRIPLPPPIAAKKNGRVPADSNGGALGPNRLHAPGSGMGWGVLGGVSVLLLLLALALPSGISELLAVAGFVGLMVLRLTAMHRGWLPRGFVLASRRATSDTIVGYHGSGLDSTGGEQ